jgi:hypothetical protein
MYVQTVHLFTNTNPPRPHIYISLTDTNKNDTERLQKDLDTLGEWAVENGMKINPSKCKAIRFMRAQVKNPLGYSLCDQKIPEASNCKYLRIIIRPEVSSLLSLKPSDTTIPTDVKINTLETTP